MILLAICQVSGRCRRLPQAEWKVGGAAQGHSSGLQMGVQDWLREAASGSRECGGAAVSEKSWVNETAEPGGG